MPGSNAPEYGVAGGRIRWAVLGVGGAGRARAKAIEADPRSELVAVYRGRHAAQFRVAQLASLEDAIAAADAVAICSPTPVHVAQVEAALAAGRHVIVEFPLAEEPEDARRLLAMAHEAGRVLHVEHIELLGGAAAVLRKQVNRAGIKAVSCAFTADGPGDLAGAELALRNVARLHRVVDAVGPFARVDAVESGASWLRAELRTTTGAPVALSFRVGPGLPRETRLIIDDGHVWEQLNRSLTRDGEAFDLPEQPGLFDLDQRIAVARILDGEDGYMSEARILHVLTMADQLRDGELGHLPFLLE